MVRFERWSGRGFRALGGSTCQFGLRGRRVRALRRATASSLLQLGQEGVAYCRPRLRRGFLAAGACRTPFDLGQPFVVRPMIRIASDLPPMKLQHCATQSQLGTRASAIVAELNFEEPATQLFDDGAQSATREAVLWHVNQEGDDIEHGDGGREDSSFDAPGLRLERPNNCCTCATPPEVEAALLRPSASLPPSDSGLKILVSAVQFRPRIPSFLQETGLRPRLLGRMCRSV
jgi:hypothetical protein